MSTPRSPHYIILGAGVIGLTSALELSSRLSPPLSSPSSSSSSSSSSPTSPISTPCPCPSPHITILAKHLPGDQSIGYTSPWAGANWLSTATDSGREEERDAVTYRKFEELSRTEAGQRETGVRRMWIRASFDREVEEAGVLSYPGRKRKRGGSGRGVDGDGGGGVGGKGEGDGEEGRIWYEELVGGLRWLKEGERAEGSVFGFELESFVVNVQVYLPWLQGECLKRKIEMRIAEIEDIRDVFSRYPDATAVFNCTGLGSYTLKGVEDKNLYPTRGQIMLVESPSPPLERMYFRSPQRVNPDTTYVFPRNPGGGVILGGCRFDNEWEGEVDLGFAEDIKRRCCALAPELGRPEDLKVISHGVGLRPSRRGGPRIEKEMIGRYKVIHNYGAGGTGYQASWGMAKEAVDLLQRVSKL